MSARAVAAELDIIKVDFIFTTETTKLNPRVGESYRGISTDQKESANGGHETAAMRN